jgi:hypothetical protein
MKSNLEVFGMICSPYALQSEVERLQAKFPNMKPEDAENDFILAIQEDADAKPVQP